MLHPGSGPGPFVEQTHCSRSNQARQWPEEAVMYGSLDARRPPYFQKPIPLEYANDTRRTRNRRSQRGTNHEFMTECDIDPPHSQAAGSTSQWVEIPMSDGPSAKSVIIQAAGSPLQLADSAFFAP